MCKLLILKVLDNLKDIFKKGLDSWLFMVKLIAPALLITRLILVFDLISYLDVIFRPIMKVAGLPPEMTLVWLSSMLGNLYVGLSVYMSLAPNIEPITVMQATIIGGMCLLAHGLIIEGQVCRGTGLSFWRVTLFRIFSAIIFGIIIRLVSELLGWGYEIAEPRFAGITINPMPGWGEWVFASCKQLLMIFILVEILLAIMAVIKLLGLPRLIIRFLAPPLKLAGIGHSAIMVTIIGCVMGLTYGGGLIVAESKSGYVSKSDIYGAMMLMAVFHSLFEDTFLMWAIGGSLLWLLGARLVFALLLTSLLTRLAKYGFWRHILVGSGSRTSDKI